MRRHGELVAQGGTHLTLNRAIEIGNIVTARAHRRQGYGSQVVSALVRALCSGGKSVFLQVFKDNVPAIACYERLGFEPLRTMYLARCQMEEGGVHHS
jgi:ribosomal protein S18 acetylase RimI-like enzyme